MTATRYESAFKLNESLDDLELRISLSEQANCIRLEGLKVHGAQLKKEGMGNGSGGKIQNVNMSWVQKTATDNAIMCPVYLNDSRKELLVSVKI